MKETKCIFILTPIYCIVFIALLAAAHYGSKAATVISENSPIRDRWCIIIDAGHGGVDGGAVSCTGVPESKINLEIALRLDDLCHLLGMDTKMIRTTDCSIHTQGNTIASKKVSDLKERVRIANETNNAIIVSIHQNKYAQSKYRGAQVFYAPTSKSDTLAKMIQAACRDALQTSNNRKIKEADGVYLMEHIQCTGVLVECGFLSNPEEEALLRSQAYQQKIACVIASSCSRFINLETSA